MAQGKAKGRDVRKGREHVPGQYRKTDVTGEQDRIWVHRKLDDESTEFVRSFVSLIHPHQATRKEVGDARRRQSRHYKGPYFTLDLLRTHEITRAIASAALHEIAPEDAAKLLKESLTPAMLEPVTFDVVGLTQEKGSISLGLEQDAPTEERTEIGSLLNLVIGEEQDWAPARGFRPAVAVAFGDLNKLRNRSDLNENLPTVLTFTGVEVSFNK